MKKLFLAAIFFSFLVPVNSVSAFDPACEPVLKASEVRAKMSSWQSSTEVNGGSKHEFLKVGGQFYMRVGSGKWGKMAGDPDQAESDFAAKVRSDVIKITECKNVGSETMDGVATNVISYHVEMGSGPSASAKLYIGVSDGLPYAQFSEKTEAHYRYKDLTGP